MDVTSELAYIPRLFLRDCHPHSKGFNFKHDCPDGPDRKRRGFLMVNQDSIVVYCFNCGCSMNFRRFIEQYHPHVFEDYRQEEKTAYLDKMRAGTFFQKKSPPVQLVIPIENRIKDLHVFTLNEKYFVPAKTSRKCIEYCAARKFPDHIIDTLKYCIHPNKMWSDMLIFPMYWKDNKQVYGFQ